MNKMKGLPAVPLLILLMIILLPARAAANGAVYTAGNEAQLSDVLQDIADGDTIRLTGDFTYTAPVTINGIGISFDLNGHTLNIAVSSGMGALLVENRGSVSLTGMGELNVGGQGDYVNGVYVQTGGSATVTNAAADGDFAYGAFACTGGTIKVRGNATATGINSAGACAQEPDATVTVDGDATSSGDGSSGVLAMDGGTVKVGGSSTSEGEHCFGVFAGSGTVIIDADASAAGPACTGAYAAGGTITVGRDAKAEGESSSGAAADFGGAVIVNGSAMAEGQFSYGARAYSPDGTSSSVQVAVNAAATGSYSFGSYADGSGASVGVSQNTSAAGDNSCGAKAVNAGTVTVGGSAWADGSLSCGAYSAIDGSSVEVGQTARASGDTSCGAYALSGGTVTVDANVTATDGANCAGAVAEGGTITVGGDATAEGDGSCGAKAISHGTVKITGSSGAGGSNSFGVCADGDGSSIEVGHTASADGEGSIGASSAFGSTITIGINAEASGENSCAITASNAGTALVSGSASSQGAGGYGAFVSNGGAVTVGGDIISNGEYSFGIRIINGGTVAARGNVTASGRLSCGADVYSGGTAAIECTITAPVYIRVDYMEKSAGNGVRGTGSYSNYLIYSKNSSTVRVRIRVSLNITTTTLPAATIGTAYSKTISADYTGSGTLSFSAAGLPNGLSINTHNGTIIGTPAAGTDAGSPYSVEVEVTDGELQDSAVLSLVIKAPAAVPIINTHPADITRRVGEKAVFTVAATAADGGVLSYRWQKSTNGGTTWNNITLATNTSYTTGTLTLADNGNKYRCTVTNTKNGTNAALNSNTAALTVVTPTLSITTAALDAATVGLPYSKTIEYSYTENNTLIFSATGLPDGLAINASTGVISGIPDDDTDTGSPYSVEVKVSDGTLTDIKSYRLAVNAAEDEVVSISAIPGVTAPVRGTVPVTAISETAQYTGSITWSPSDSTFKPGTVYTATITLYPKAGYTLNGVTEDFFTVAGAASVSNAADSGVITAVFPATEAIRNAVINPSAAVFRLDAPSAVVTTISDWGSASTVTGIVYGASLLSSPGDFNMAGTELTITEEYLSGLNLSDGDTVELTISFDMGAASTFTIEAQREYIPGADASLSNLTVGGSTVNAFSSGRYEYDVELPNGTQPGSASALVGAAPSDPRSEVVIVQATVLPGDAEVKVTSEDGNTTKTYTIHFTLEAAPVRSYPLTITAGTGGSITAGSNGTYTAGTVISIAAAASAGYSFHRWSSTGGGTFGSTTSASTTFIMPAGAAAITASFRYNSNDSGGNSDGGSGGGEGASSVPAPSAAPVPVYKAEVSMAGIATAALPVPVDASTGNASVNIGTLQGNIFNGTETTIVTVPSIPGVSTYTLSIPAGYLSDPHRESKLIFSTNKGSITLPSDMLAGASGAGANIAEITIGSGDKSALSEAAKAFIGDRPLIELKITLDGKQTDWNNPGAPVTVSVPYAPPAAELEHSESIILCYLDGNGKAAVVPNGHYDPDKGVVTFTTGHFSIYAIGYNNVSFKDVPANAWYGKAVGFIAAREITTGTGGGNFSPGAQLTRGEFLVMLMKAYGIAPDTNPKDNFTDAGSTWYTGYLAAAKRLGISGGTGNNSFEPGKKITRQEMFTLLYNTLKTVGKLPEAEPDKALPAFSDAREIAPWARAAMSLMTQAGIASGSGGKLSPADTATRAEMAQVLYKLLSQ